MHNYAFIDSQNLNLGIQKLGWKLDYRKFRVYLKEKYDVVQAFMFIGFVATNQRLYDDLAAAGFILKFKPTIPDSEGKLKGNIDADLVLCAVVASSQYDKAVVVSRDGDFYSLVEHLYVTGKLEVVLSTHPDMCSSLLKGAAKERIEFMYELRERLEYINEKTPQ